MGYSVYGNKGLGFEKVADTNQMEDGEKVLDNYKAGYVEFEGQAVAAKNLRPTDIEKDLRKRRS